MLVRLALSDFRNHADAVIEPGPGFVALTGENGAGKTNVLEAVSLLAPGRGLRRATFPAMARQGGSGGFGVAATLIGDATLGTGVQPGAPERRLVRVNGVAAPATALAEWLAVLWLTPAMDRLFAEGAGERRRFLDRLTLALEPGHAGHATRYETAMRERNRLLADEAPADPQWLAALETRMAEHGAAVDAARRRTVAALSAILDAANAGPFARPSLAIEGWQGERDTLSRELASGRSRDAAAGRALAGPHRADLSVTHRDKGQPAALCSTGEQKALLLAIVLAHADLVAATMPHPPVLLLDEVAAHLDPLRRAALFERLAGKGQVWMTGTEAALFVDLPADATRLHVDAGHVTIA
ncbi:DNA replication/repair protein RecF [Sphingomonas spermidinifaciens]|uniref:DNA replication and repair protein RecF n=1 Tax=Sphingomonas spermidinifaciens TaxID=1141889 RepID=A0A2A4B7M0_9SPHN|nr:DNA replication/repair protein RecF [Sphingomonas spermidinifaciens]PCD04461.1 DNA replication/repair protein RecF [Sphingomonas spermidinifaciens]